MRLKIVASLSGKPAPIPTVARPVSETRKETNVGEEIIAQIGPFPRGKNANIIKLWLLRLRDIDSDAFVDYMRTYKKNNLVEVLKVTDSNSSATVAEALAILAPQVLFKILIGFNRNEACSVIEAETSKSEASGETVRKLLMGANPKYVLNGMGVIKHKMHGGPPLIRYTDWREFLNKLYPNTKRKFSGISGGK